MSNAFEDTDAHVWQSTGTALCSIAISLKRLADWLTAGDHKGSPAASSDQLKAVAIAAAEIMQQMERRRGC